MTDHERLPRTLLEQIVQEGDYTLEELCAQFDKLARDSDVAATLSVRQLQRWMAGAVDNARPASRRVAARLWGQPFTALIGPPVFQGDSPTSMAPTDSPVESVGWERTAVAMAHESTRHAAEHGGSVDMMTIEQLQAEAWRLARGYATHPPIVVLVESRRARDVAYLLLDRTRRPRQTNDLFLVAGQVCGLMAVASFDLAVWDASIEQARAAYVYGELIDHPGLRAWARGHQALVAYWMGDPHRAVALADAGLTEAPAGTPRARLHCIAARAWAHTGDHRRTRASLAAADEALNTHSGRDDLHDEIAGEFGWGRSRHAACAGSALVQLGDGPGAVDRIRTALDLHPTDPRGGLVVERAYCDLAAAELARRDLDAAGHALEPVWALPAVRRREAVTARLLGIERVLAAKQWQRDRQAAEMRDHIVMFNAEASARALPAASG